MRRRGRPPHPDILTPREWEVLALVRQGLSNDEVAARLGVAPSTAKFHVSAILGKLGVASREEAARWRPPEGHGRGGRLAALAPVAMLRGLRLGPAAGGAIAAAALAGVGVLAWGVVVAGGGNGARPEQPVTRAAANDPGRGMRATEGGVLPWMTYRVSGGDLPQAVTVPFTEYLLATDLGRAVDGPPGDAAPAGVTTYRIEFVRADNLATTIGAPGAYVTGTTPLWQGPSITVITDPSSAPRWGEAPGNVAALLERYIALGRTGALPEEPTLAESIEAAQTAGRVVVMVGGKELGAGDRDRFLSLFGGATPVRLGVRGNLIGQRALKPVTVEVRLGEETLTFAYIPPGSVARQGLLMGTNEVGSWEFSAIVSPPAYAQDAYTIPAQMDALMTRLGYVGGTTPADTETRIMPLLDADMSMRIDRVILSDGASETPVNGVDPDKVECPAGVDLCGPEAAPVPAGRTPLTLTVWRRGFDPFPEAQEPAVYAYYPPRTTGERGVLVRTKAGAVWNATLGTDGGSGYYAAPATEAALEAAVRKLGRQ